MSDKSEDNHSMDGEGSEDEQLQGSRKRKEQPSPDMQSERRQSKAKRVKGIDDEAAESEDEDVRNSSDEDDSVEDDTQYVEDGFLVRDDANSDSGSSEEESGSDADEDEGAEEVKKKELQRLKKRNDEVRLDDEDVELIRENTARLAGRVKGAARDAEASPEDSREIAPEVRKRSNTINSEEHGGGDADGAERADGRSAGREDAHGYYDSDDDGSDMGGFIVAEDDEGEGDENADEFAPRRAAPRPEGAQAQSGSRRVGRREGPRLDQLQEAMDIFGAGFDDFSDEEEENMGGGAGADSDRDEAGAEDGAERGKESKGELSKRDQRRIQKLRARYERAHLVATFCTERDDVLRSVDRPERMQQVLVGRDTPQEAERLMEARWMATRLTARMLADRHLDPSRRTVPLVANPQAAYASVLYENGFDGDKEDCLKKELQEPIAQVLRFMQVDNLEVPFIWSYRRDYLHPVMTRQHLWFLASLEEEWESKVHSKLRLSEEIAALVDAAKMADGDVAAEAEEALASLQRNIQRNGTLLAALQSELRVAEAEVQEAMDLVDERDEPSPEDRQRVTETSTAAEALQAREKEAAEELRRMQAQEADLLARLRRQAKYHPVAAKEALRLFPPERYLGMVRDSTDDQELRDIVAFWRLVTQNAEADAAVTAPAAGASPGEEGDSQTQSQELALAGVRTKKALRLRRDEYARYKSIPALRALIEQMCLPVHEFGDAIRHGYRSEVPATPESSCEEAAAVVAQTCSQFSNVQQVLKAVRVVVGTELSREPSVREFVRGSFKRNATVSTRPTAKGRSAITPFHELFGLHFLDRKPLRDFYAGADRTLFIRLEAAERAGLLTITIDLPSVKRMMPRSADGSVEAGVHEVETRDIASLFMQVLVNFMPRVSVNEDFHPESRKSWDRERLMCLQACEQQHLTPSLQAEVRRDLLRIGKEVIVQEAAENFARALAVGPYIPPYQDVRERVRDTLRACPNRPFYASVAAIYVSVGRGEPMCMAYVNRDGVLRAHDLIPAQALNQKDERIKRFLVENRPDLVVSNASGAGVARSTASVIEKSILGQVEEEVKRRDFARREGRMEGVSYADDDEEFVPYRAQVMVLKDELPRIFMGSQRSKDMCPDLQPGEAAAVCLARYAQEPLAEYCCAWKSANSQEVFGHELLFLKTHEHLDLLKGARQALLNALEQRLVDAVCDVGVDVNKACAHDHLAPLLAFVGGLGLRKADALRQKVRMGGKAIGARSDLLLRKLVGSNVWTNAAGFLRVTGDAEADPLDNTRIHPECYTTFDFATKICADALEVAHNNSDYVANVEKLMASSRRVLDKRMERHKRWLDLWETGQRPIPGVTPFDETARTVDGREVPLSVELTDMLSQLELDDYAAELEASGQGKRRLLFELIKDELRFPFLDLRLPLTAWTVQEMFQLLTNQTDRSVYVGMKVVGTVLDVSDESMLDERSGEYRRKQRAVVQTEAGMRGFVSMYDAVDQSTVRGFSFETFNLADVLPRGQHVEAVVVGVRKEKMHLDLSVKPNLLDKPESWWMEQRKVERQARDWWVSIGRDPDNLFDPRFNEEEALRVCREEEDAAKTNTAAVNQQLSATSLGDKGAAGGKAGAEGRSVMRVVHHPLFANVDFKKAEERLRLEGKGAGEVLIRPSSKGSNYLTITWAFQDNWYKHISVEERGKRPGDLGVGPQLFVQEDDLTEPYHDLDELFAHYIEPMNDLVSVVLKHRSFRRGTPAEVEAMMFAERAENPTRIPYFFRFEPSKPGTFALTWLSLNVKSEAPVRTLRVEVRPFGLRAQGVTFVRPSDLIVWFKETQASAAAKQQHQEAEARRAARASAVNAANAAAGLGGGAYGARPMMPPSMAMPAVEPIRRSRFHN